MAPGLKVLFRAQPEYDFELDAVDLEPGYNLEALTVSLQKRCEFWPRHIQEPRAWTLLSFPFVSWRLGKYLSSC